MIAGVVPDLGREVLGVDQLGPVHLIGVGGVGMSGIARLLLARGVPVSGSDAKESATLTARTTGAVHSGRSVRLRPPLSANVYISFSTMSVVSPTPRTKRSVDSNIGVRISP